MSENKLVNASIILIGVVVLALVLKALQSFLRPFVLAIILSFLLMPLIRLSKKKKIPASITIIGLILILVISISSVVSLIVKEGSKIDENALMQQGHMQGAINNIQSVLSKANLNINQFLNPEKINMFAISLVQSLVQAIGAIFSELFLAIIFMIFLIPSREAFMKNVGKNLSKPKMDKFKSAISQTEKSIRDYLRTKSIISLGTAITSAIILAFFKADFIFIFALLFFILNFIPNVGSFVAVGLALVFYILTHGLGMNILWLALLLILVQILFGNILEPKIAGDKLNLSPIVILLSLLIWYWIWGIVGMILAVPITSIIKIILEHTDKTKKAARLMS